MIQGWWNTWASSYLSLQKDIKAKQTCLSIQNNDKKLLHPAQLKNHPDRVSKYQEYEHELNMSGIQYPVDIKDIGKLEHQNNIGFNVYAYEDEKIFLLPITIVTTTRHPVNLLCITAAKTSYYVLMKDLSRLVLIQYNNDNNKIYFCQYCFAWQYQWKDIEKPFGKM